MATEFDKLVQYVAGVVEDMRQGEFPDPENCEGQVHEFLLQLGRTSMEVIMESMDPKERTVTEGGQEYRRVLDSHFSALSRFGILSVGHGLYRPVGQRNGDTRSFVKERSGFMNGYLTPGVARLMAFLQGELTVRDTQRACKEMGIPVSCAVIHKLMASLNDQWENQRDEHEDRLRDQETVPEEARILCLSMDGVMAPMLSTAGQSGVPAKTEYRELGCGTLTFYDGTAEFERLRSIYHCRMPEKNKAGLTETLGREVKHIVSQNPTLTRVYVCDGAVTNWTAVESIEREIQAHFKAPNLYHGREGIQILDYYHASEHLKQACDAVHGPHSKESTAYFERLKKLLLATDWAIDSVISSLRYHKGKARSPVTLNQEITYFTNQRDRMNYRYYLFLNLPIGSGVVEAACKTIVAQRLKRSGMKWSHRGAQAVTTPRTWLKSDRFEAGWRTIRRSWREPTRQKSTPGGKPTSLSRSTATSNQS